MTLLLQTDVIETERLYLRRLEAADLEYFIQIHQDADVARYIGAGKPRSPAETEKWFQDIQDSYNNAGLGQLAVVRKTDGVRLGRCGLSDAVIERTAAAGAIRKGWFFSAHAPADADVQLMPELGYTFGKEHWGQGYASEAARSVYQYAQSCLEFPEIMSVIHADNKGSLAVAAKFNVRYIDVIELSGRPYDRYDWPLSRQQ